MFSNVNFVQPACSSGDYTFTKVPERLLGGQYIGTKTWPSAGTWTIEVEAPVKLPLGQRFNEKNGPLKHDLFVWKTDAIKKNIKNKYGTIRIFEKITYFFKKKYGLKVEMDQSTCSFKQRKWYRFCWMEDIYKYIYIYMYILMSSLPGL